MLEAGGIEVGGAVWTFPPGGEGGTFGTFSGGIVVFELGAAGVACVLVTTGPNGGGCAWDAVLLDVPGSTAESESCMLGFVFGSACLESAKNL